MNDAAEIWVWIHAAFEAHMKVSDQTPQEVLERIAQKCLGLPHQLAFNSSNCTVREEMLSLAALEQLKVYHKRTTPKRCDGPIIIINYDGQDVVIDGNNRVNLWCERQDSRLFHAIVIEANGNDT